MGSPNAPDSLSDGCHTQAWLATGTDSKSLITDQFLYHQRPAHVHPQAADADRQDQLLAAFERLPSVAFPAGS